MHSLILQQKRGPENFIQCKHIRMLMHLQPRHAESTGIWRVKQTQNNISSCDEGTSQLKESSIYTASLFVTSVQEVYNEGLCKHHLSTAQHAAPSDIRLQVRPGKCWQVPTICKPDSRLEIRLEFIKTRERFVIFILFLVI